MTDLPRRRRVNGEESRSRILDAATELAGERGYEGTSIALVSKACGLPASSIYWHFTDKDDLIAAVIERSFGQWMAGLAIPETTGASLSQLEDFTMQIAKALTNSPHFIRLGLMLALERRPIEPRARAMFLDIRADAVTRIAATIGELIPELTDEQCQRVSIYAMAGADGLFIAMEVGGDEFDAGALFQMHGRAVLGEAMRLADRKIV